MLDPDTLALVLEPASILADHLHNPVALFDRRQVLSVIATDHLVNEADVPDVVKSDPDADIPF